MDKAEILLKEAKKIADVIRNQFEDKFDADIHGDYTEVIKILEESSKLGLEDANIQLALMYCFKKKHKDYSKTAMYFNLVISSLKKKLDESSESNKAESYYELCIPYAKFNLSYLQKLIGNTEEKFIKYNDLAIKFCKDINLEVKIYYARAFFLADKLSLSYWDNYIETSKEPAKWFKKIIEIEKNNPLNSEANYYYKSALKRLEYIKGTINSYDDHGYDEEALKHYNNARKLLKEKNPDRKKINQEYTKWYEKVPGKTVPKVTYVILTEIIHEFFGLTLFNLESIDNLEDLKPWLERKLKVDPADEELKKQLKNLNIKINKGIENKNKEKETKKIFKIAVDYLKLKSADIEKSRELFAEYLKWNRNEWDVNTIVYEKIGDAYTKYSKNNDIFKSEAEINYKKAFNYFFENKDETDLLAETYRYSLAEYYLKGIGTPVSRDKSYEMLESWYEYISKKSLEYNRKVRGSDALKIYSYLALFNGCNDSSLSRKIQDGGATDYEGLKIWFTRILEIIPTHREATRDIKLVDHYLKNPKILELAKRRVKRMEEEREEREANEIIFNKVKSCLVKKPPDFDKAYKIYFENNSDEFSSEILNLEQLGNIYIRVATSKDVVLLNEAKKLHKSAFELCKKEKRNDFNSAWTLGRYYFEGIGTEKSFEKGQFELILSFQSMPEGNDEEKQKKAIQAVKISKTYQKEDLHRKIFEEAKEDLKEAKTWLLKAKRLGRFGSIDERIEELEQKINSQNSKKIIQEYNQNLGDRSAIEYSYSWNYNGNIIKKRTLWVHQSHYIYKLLSEFEHFANQLGKSIDLYFNKSFWKGKYVPAKLQDIGDLCLKTVLEGIKENNDPMGLGKLDLKRMFFDPDFYVLMGCRVTLKNNLHYVEPRKLVVEEDIEFFEKNGYWRHTKDNINMLRGSDLVEKQSNKIKENNDKSIDEASQDKNIFDLTLLKLLVKKSTQEKAESVLEKYDTKNKIAKLVFEIVNETINDLKIPNISLMSGKQIKGVGLFLCLYIAAIVNIYRSLHPNDKIKNDEIHFLSATLFTHSNPEDISKFVLTASKYADNFLSNPIGQVMFKTMQDRLTIYLNDGKNPNNVVNKIPLPELSFEEFSKSRLSSLLDMVN